MIDVIAIVLILFSIYVHWVLAPKIDDLKKRIERLENNAPRKR